MLRDALEAGRFVVTAELGPPREPRIAPVRDAARLLAGAVDAVNVTDNQAATVKLSPLVASGVLLEEGVDPILQLTGRDRNLLALQSDLLGAWALGVRTVLALSGDPLRVGLYEDLAKAVCDVDSLALARLITDLNGGRLAAGETLESPTGFWVVGAVNPLVDALERIHEKLDAGVGLLQTNIVYDVEALASWLAPLVDAGIPERAPMLVGVAPPRSMTMLRHMHEHIPGVEVDGATFARMDGLKGERAMEAGIELAAEIVTALRDVPGVGGVHLMAPGWDTEAVLRVVRASKLDTGRATTARS
jgi:methylenetetrahydrofolate reductase (NADPH)